MACFCVKTAEAVRNRFTTTTGLALPPAPLQMKLAAALPTLGPAERADVKLALAMQSMRLPNVTIAGGPLASVAMTLSMAGGTFTIDDLPKLEAQMAQAAESFQRNVWPRLQALASLKVQPLLNLAIAARLVLDLRAMGLDPMTAKLGDIPPPPPGPSQFRFALTPPQLAMARFLAALPPLLKVNEAFKLPPLGEPGVAPALQNRLQAMAKLNPPSISIPISVMLKLAMVLESLAKIEEAFGTDPLAPSKLGPIKAMMTLWAGFPLPLPMPALALSEKLAVLPPLEDVKLGEAVAGQSKLMAAASFTPPKLAIAPFLNVMIALNATLRLAAPAAAVSCTACSAPLAA